MSVISADERDGEEASPVANLNTILFGPPGTGKTYKTIDEALRIVEPDFFVEHANDRLTLKRRFDELVADPKSPRIRFVTFHQSFSYEDFVEGLRAESDESDDKAIRYFVEKGIFRRICEDAIAQPVEDEKLGISSNPRLWKIAIDGTNKNSKKRSYCFSHNEARIGWGHTGDLLSAQLENPEFRLGSNDRSCLQSFAHEIQAGDIMLCIGSNTEVLAVGVVSGKYRYEVNPPEELGDYKHVLPVQWFITDLQFSILSLNSQKQFTLKTLYELTRFSWPELMNALLSFGIELPFLNKSSKSEMRPTTPYVLIIDEINRGNISRIFGELITLIEPSKRQGADEALEVVLPYSKNRFSVPSNVYLLGTMNTADRSLLGLDIALRRRFTFKEMPPRPELLDKVIISGVNLGELLRVMNQRIEVLLDRDHCLGHAYFLPLQNAPKLERLAKVFREQIIPLLQEYFFEDWERISWVLNDQNENAPANVQPFLNRPIGNLQKLFGKNVAPDLRDNRWSLNDAAFSSADSYLNILKVSSV